MTDRSGSTGGQGDRLFKNMDEQEQIYAPQQDPGNERVAADENSGIVRSSIDNNTPVAVPLGTGGSLGAAPASDEFDLGMEREERDLREGDTDVVGRDPSDEQIDPRRTR